MVSLSTAIIFFFFFFFSLILIYIGRVTYSDQLVFGTSSQVAAVRAEADASNVEIRSHVGSAVVFQDAHLLASLDIENLG